MNVVAFTGRLVAKPYVNYNKEKKWSFTTFSIACNERKGITNFFRVRAVGKFAEFIGDFYEKGDLVEITGKLRVVQESYGKEVYGRYMRYERHYIDIDTINLLSRPHEKEDFYNIVDEDGNL